MKNSVKMLAFAAIVAVACRTTAFAATELAIGAGLPKADVKLTDIADKSISLADAKGKNGLLVIFSCNTCPYVIASEERYKSIAEVCAANGVGMILLNANEAQRDGVDSLAEMKAHAQKYGYTFSYAIDANAELADAFGATRTPHIFLFNKDQALVYRGAIDDSVMDATKVEKQYLADAIKAMAAGTEIAVKETKAIGCSIKTK